MIIQKEMLDIIATEAIENYAPIRQEAGNSRNYDSRTGEPELTMPDHPRLVRK